MNKVRYWQKDIETIGRRALEELQLKRLRSGFGRLYRNVPSFREKCRAAGVSPSAINSLKDITRIPFTTSDDLRAGILPVCLPLVAIVQSGCILPAARQANRRQFFSRRRILHRLPSGGTVSDHDRDRQRRCSAEHDDLRTLYRALMMHYGAEKVGALVIPAGPGKHRTPDCTHAGFRYDRCAYPAELCLVSGDVHAAAWHGSEEGSFPQNVCIWVRSRIPKKTRLKIEKLFGIECTIVMVLTEMNVPVLLLSVLRKRAPPVGG